MIYYYQLAGLRQDTDANRLTCTPAIGEPFWTTDLQELWMGDGATAGGLFVGSKFTSQVWAEQSPAVAGSLTLPNPATTTPNPSGLMQWFSKGLQRLFPAAGVGAYNYVVSLSRAKALPGATIRVYVELPASTNPTVIIQDLTGSVVLANVTSPNGGTAPAYFWGDFQLAEDGAWHLTARGWN